MVGIVEYNLDPQHQGRLKIRVHGVNDQKEDDKYVIPTEMLPWARPASNGSGGSASGSGCFSVPKVGSAVEVSGSLNSPVWYGNLYISDETVSEINSTDYTNSHVLIYDTDFNNGDAKVRDEHIKVFFTERKGFVIEYKTSSGVSSVTLNNTGVISITNPNGDGVVISNGTINIMSDNAININAPIVNLSDQATESVMKGETLKNIFNSHTHTCNSGETTPPMQKLTSDSLNSHVKI